MGGRKSIDLLALAKLCCPDLHEEWSKIGPSFGYYPEYQDVNSKSATLIKSLKVFNGKRVLDIGCNSGMYSYLVGANAEYVLGCDVEPILIARARKSAAIFSKHFDCSRVLFEQCSFTDKLELAFNGILASLVLYHVGDEALYALADYLIRNRPTVVLQTRPGRAKAFESHPEWGVVSGTKLYGGMYRVEDNLDFLRDCGYENVVVSGLTSTLFHGEYFPVVIAEP